MKFIKPILFIIYLFLIILSMPFSYLGRAFTIISLILKGDFYTLKRYTKSFKQHDNI